jgi:acetyltransferase-like isoleucine patch superfamily enzyme
MSGPVRRLVGRGFVGVYRFQGRAHGKIFSLLSSGAFASFGTKSVLQPPIRLQGERRIAVGTGVFVGAGSWLQVLEGSGRDVALEIGDDTSIAGGCVLSAAASVRLGRKVLIARNAYVADHIHSYDDPSRAVLDQGVTRIESVEIGDGAWLGENVVVGPGVKIGRGAVIGANAVVLDDVPDHALAVGVPAQVVRQFGRPDVTVP